MIVDGQLVSAQAEALASSPSNAPDGRFFYDTAEGCLKYRDGVRSRWEALSLPVGTILAFHPGYYSGASNAGFNLSGGPGANTAAGVNAYLPACWRVCNGAALNDSSSPIFNGAGRRLPDLTDDRFLMGDTVTGNSGGDNDSSHTHSVTSNVAVAAHAIGQPAFTVDQHTHAMAHVHGSFYKDGSGNLRAQATADEADTDLSNDSALFAAVINGALAAGATTFYYDPGAAGGTWYTGGVINPPQGTAGAGSETDVSAVNTTTRTASVTLTNNHSVTNNAVTSGAASFTENRPLYLSCFYIMKVR